MPWNREGEDDDRLAPQSPDPERRARMRRRVLRSLSPRPPGLSDRLYGAVAIVAGAAPFLARGLAVVLIASSFFLAAGVAAADSLPDEPLYPVKIATEQLRLALATTSEDRATVELSLAGHRLAEAERLAENGREDAALEASSAYGTHLANAAAELAASERPAERTEALVGQLESRLAKQRESAANTAARLALDPRTATAAKVLATVTATAAPSQGSTPAARIAANAAAFADRAATAAAEFAIANGAKLPAAPRAPATVDGDEGDGGDDDLPVITPRPGTATAPGTRTAAPALRPAPTPQRTSAATSSGLPLRTATPAPARPTALSSLPNA